MSEEPNDPVFAVLVEVGIISQLATAVLELCLPNGLMSPHFAVLNHLVRLGNGQTPLEIARALQVPKNSFTHTLSGLEKRELVETKANPEDGRSKQVWITKEGRSVRKRAIEALGPLFQRVQSQAKPGTLDVLLPNLRELRVIMDNLRDPDR